MSTVRLLRLKSDHEAIRRLGRMHPRIEIEGVSGSPPDRYIFKLFVSSLRERGDDIEPQREHRLEVRLPLGYPRDAPLCRMLTPVFHPNIAPHTVCVGDHWSAAESLDALVQRVGEMLGYQSYNVKSPLNGRAAQWVAENPHRVPTDREEFFVDLAAEPAARDIATSARCDNCGAPPSASCASGHALCADCTIRCETCGRLLCLVCHETACTACAAPEIAAESAPEIAAQAAQATAACANCGAVATEAALCAGSHALCRDCAVRCDSCARILCLVCGEYPCARCAAAPPPSGLEPLPGA